jgi:hypothetical protein
MRKFTCISVGLLLSLLASCGHKDSVVTPKPETGAPLAQAADLPDSLDLMSGDANALEAKAWANELFNAVWFEAGMARAILYPSRVLVWRQVERGCWRCSYSYGADTLSQGVYLACAAVHGHRWRFDHRQWCAPGVPCGYYLIARGTTGTAGLTGAFTLYSRSDSTLATFSWKWTASTDVDSIQWTFYRGEISSGTIAATLDWSEDGDGAKHWVWAWPADERWEMQVAANPTTGWLKDYLWSAAASEWHLAQNFNWSGGHGTWDTYGAGGQIVRSLSW